MNIKSTCCVYRLLPLCQTVCKIAIAARIHAIHSKHKSTMRTENGWNCVSEQQSIAYICSDDQLRTALLVHKEHTLIQF
jgi:hypothetical protein